MSRFEQIIEPERIEEVEYADIMSTSYVNYAMSVIMSRAVPDVRDGLKPVQRRIIYDMRELGTTSDKMHRKSARIVGDTMGKYHPHGDSAIYEAMVVLSQEFKKNQPLVDGHGNFGSIEGDGAAAQRYTEARLQKFAEDGFLEDLKYDVVDMTSNYDETEKEPDVLPCKVPNLLINGAEGIAVGMTTCIPSHNTAEVIDCAIEYLKGTHDVVKLMKVLPGPDFPTGGVISNRHELENMYLTGNGRVRIRGKFVYEPGTHGEKDKLVATEIPYTMIGEGINKFLHDVANLVEDKVLPEITDIINQSKNDDIRIVFELRPKSDIERIKNVIYKKTKFEDTLGVNMLVVEKGVPKVMSLTDILGSFEKFQYQIYTRKYQKLLADAEHKREIDEGLIKAVDLIDVIIAVLRSSKNVAQARQCLTTGCTDDMTFKTKTMQSEASKLSFTEAQADAILSMQMSRLVGLQVEELNKDYEKVKSNIAEYEKLLSDDSAMKQEIIKYLKEMKKKYGRDRRTEVDDIETPDVAEIEAPEVQLMVLVDKFNYIQAIEQSNYSRNSAYIDENFVCRISISSRDKIAIFTDIGKVHLIPMKDVPLKKPRDKGVPLDNICQFNYNQEHIVGIVSLGFNICEKEFIFVSSSGYVKRTKNSEFFINRKVTDSTMLKEGESVAAVVEYDPAKILVLESSKKLLLKVKQSDIKVKSKYSQGLQGMKLNDGDTIKEVSTDAEEYKDLKFGQLGTTGKLRQVRLI